MKCPFCQQELNIDPCGEMGCPNDKCKESAFLIGTKELWQELIKAKQDIELLRTKNIDRVRSCGNCNDMLKELNHTRKALDVAVEEITKIKVAAESVGIGFFMTAAIFALAKINEIKGGKDA